MTSAKYPLAALASLTLATSAMAHEGHGTPGTIGHDLQHQLWTFAAVVAIAALLFVGDRMIAVLSNRRKRDDRIDNDHED